MSLQSLSCLLILYSENMLSKTQSVSLVSSPKSKKKNRIINVEEFFRMMIRNWKWFLLCICLSVGAAYMYLRSLQPVYERVSDLEIKTLQTLTEEDSSFLNSLTKKQNKAEMTDELYVFRSLKLAREVAERLRLDVLYYHKGAINKRYLYDERPFIMHFNDPYTQDIRLCIRPTSAQTFLILSVERNGEIRNLPSDVPPYFFGSPLKVPGFEEEVELTVDSKNYAALMSSLEEDVIVERVSIEAAAERCQTMISAEPQTNSVVRISCRAGAVSEADDILKCVATAYNTLSMQEKLSVIDKSAKFIEERIEEAAGGDSLVMAGNTLSIDQGYKKEYVQYLLRRREELMLQKTIVGAETRVIEDPMGNINPVAPVPNKEYIRFLAMGIFLPFVVMLIIALSTKKVRGRKDIEESLSIPLIGILPKNRIDTVSRKWYERFTRTKDELRASSVANRELLISADTDSKTADAFHILRSNLSYLNLDGTTSLQVMMFSSLTPYSGKCFASVNVASILADEKDARCLWIDMDINSDHQCLSLLREMDRHSEMPGLTSFLSGKEELEHCIYPSANNKSLDIMLSGPVPPNPIQLLMGERLDTLIESLRKTYKYIIINSSASNDLAETAICSRFVDLTSIVVRVDRTSVSQLDDIEKICLTQRFKNACCVLTGAEQDRNRLFYGYKTGEGYDIA